MTTMAIDTPEFMRRQPVPTPSRHFLFFLCLVFPAWCIPLAGCAAPADTLQARARDAHERAGATTLPGRADWNDIDAAVDLAASKNEMAVEGSASPNDDTRVYHLRTVGDEPTWVTVRRIDDAGGVEITVSVGRFGSRDQERSLAETIRARLQTLRGRDYAPAG